MEEGLWKIVLTILCVAAFIAIVLWRIWPIITFKKRAIRVSGVITNWVSAKKGTTHVFRPIISFTTEDGETKTFTSEDQCEGKPLFPKSTGVEILYDPKNPENFRVTYPNQDQSA